MSYAYKNLWSNDIKVFYVGIVFAFACAFVCGRRNNTHFCSHKNNSNYDTEANYISKYEEKRNLLRKLADENKDKTISNSERMKMYKMCGVDDKLKGYVLNIEDLKTGIENYLEN